MGNSQFSTLVENRNTEKGNMKLVKELDHTFVFEKGE